MDCFFIKFSYLNYYEFIELHHFFKKNSLYQGAEVHHLIVLFQKNP